jgi:hypothetical protein
VTFFDWLVYRQGLWRIWWGSCPKCNSDAPKLDHCRYCNGHREWRDRKERRDERLRWMKKHGVGWFAC